MLVFFDGTHYWLSDGFHSHAACVDIGLEFVDVRVREGSLRDAQLYFFSANANHGKRNAVMAMLADAEWCQWSSNQIAKACGVSHPFVERVRSESVTCNVSSEDSGERTYTTKHRTESKMKTANIGRHEEQEPEYKILNAEPKRN